MSNVTAATKETTTTSSSNSSSSNHHHRNPLHGLLAALSFETIKLHSLRSKPRGDHTLVPSLATTTAADSSSFPIVVQASHILHGTLDPDGHVEDVFYDALQKGDGVSPDEFKIQYRRESVVMSSLQRHDFVEAEDIVGPHLGDSDVPRKSLTATDEVRIELEDSDDLVPEPPPPPQELPLRFLRAGKGDPEQGLRRYEQTLAWRKENKVDTILREPNYHFDLIKANYPHFCHGIGKNGERCYYEQPPKTDLSALRAGGLTLDGLLRHYVFVSEFQWQLLERDDLQRSIYVIDLDGIRLGDFVGEVVDFVRKASELSAQHYPERCGTVFVINVPSWFRLIWAVVKPFCDEVTLKKIYILRGAEEIQRNMQERIDLNQIPKDYGGQSCALGESEDEALLRELVLHNNAVASGEKLCNGPRGNPPCKFCSWVPARSY